MWPPSSSSSPSTAALTVLLLLPVMLLSFQSSTHAFNVLSISQQSPPLRERTLQTYPQQNDDLDGSSRSSSSSTNQHLGLLGRVSPRTRTLENIRCPQCLSVDDEVFLVSSPSVPSPKGDSSSTWIYREGGEERGREVWRPSPGTIPPHISISEFTWRLYSDKPWVNEGMGERKSEGGQRTK